MNAARRAAAFLDRDGVVVEEVGYLSCAADVRLTAGAAAAIARLNARDVPVVVVTADASPGVGHRLKSLGAEAVLTKPVDVGEVLSWIDHPTARRF